MIMLIIIVAILVYVAPTMMEQRRNEFNELIDLATTESEMLKKAQSAVEFVGTWNSLVDHVEKIRSTYKSAVGARNKKDIENMIDLVRSIRGSEEFYWMLRNSIDRCKKRTIKNIKVTYANSQKYKQDEYNRFLEDINSVKHIFDDETIAFANACVDEVSYALGGASARRLPKKDEYIADQRRLVTPSLRYDIMKRDGFRCVICGRGAEDGVKLHVDHIKPVSKGGKSTPSNLRTLCQDCNLGKSAKYDSDDSAYLIDELEMSSVIDND